MSTAVAIKESASLTVVERAKLALGISAEHEQQLREMASKTTDIVTITNADGYQQVHSARMALKTQRVEIEKKGKATREESTAFSKAVIAEEKRAIGIISPEEERLQALQETWDDAREAEKQARIDAETKRVTDLQERVAELNGNTMLSTMSDPDLIAGHISDLEKIVVDASFEEFERRALDAKTVGLARLRSLHDAAVARVAEDARLKAERAELEQLRAAQAERDRAERERIAAEEKAAKAAREEELRLQRAEQARIDAELKAKREAQEVEAAAERKRLADERAEFERQQEEARRVREKEEAERAEQARIASLKRPTDGELIGVLMRHYRAPESKVVEWLLSIDFSKMEAA